MEPKSENPKEPETKPIVTVKRGQFVLVLD